MNPKINFTPGPSQLYFTVHDHVRTAFRDGIPSLSHRSKVFETIFQEVTEGLRELLGIPPHYSIVFTGSATEIWERVIQNLVEEHSHHYINGAFSQRFFEIAGQLNKKPTKTEANLGEGFTLTNVPRCELIAVTHNETSTGVSTPIDFISLIRENNPDTLIAIDAVSSLPYGNLDYTKIDSAFFSVQKGFGLPAGLGVWIVNERCLAKADNLLAKGISIGSYHNLPTLIANAKKSQTPETPNVLAIYLLSKVVQDMLRRGVQMIRRETEYKAAILYQALKSHPRIKPFVANEAWQSKTVIVAESTTHTNALTDALLKKGMQPGEGYGPAKRNQLRFANFPAHSKEQFELLVDTLSDF